LFLSISLIPLLNITLATLESTADKGSSKRYMSLSEYKALAKDSLALYPPLSLTPFSPTNVESPSGISFKSIKKELDFKTF
jgi:hypothetical protein